jgi:hypothetical protein
MNRRSLDIEGMVNFPVSFETNSNEGGMFVRLWVSDDHLKFDKQYGVCSGTHFCYEIQESFIGTDTTKKLRKEYDNLYIGSSKEEYKVFLKEEAELIKKMRDPFVTFDGYTKILIADILLGSTGWSNGNFVATYEDLTIGGHAIYDMMKTTYPKAKLYLVTFLDT